MVVTGDYKCKVCESITRIRVQLGWLDKYPIRIKCGNCSISIFGTVILDQKNIGYSINLKNVTLMNERGNPDFLIEVSGELLTEKMSKHNKEYDINFSPFFKNGLFPMGENFGEFKANTTSFLNAIENDWPIVKRINELWFNGNHEYMPKEIHKLLNRKQFPVDNALELLRAVHFINSKFTNNFAKKYFIETTELIFQEINNIKDKTQLFLLAQHFEVQIIEYENKIFDITNKFIEKFHMMIPIFGLDFYEKENIKEEAIKKLGLTTVDFEDIKDFYIDTFEDLGNSLNLIVAYNNIIHRSDFKKMNEDVNKEIRNLEDFAKMRNKGKKLEFITTTENLDKIFTSKLDNRLRNAIVHRSYTYDILSQKITYYPSGDSLKGSSSSLYLTEFVLECFKLMQSCIGLGEIVYQTRKVIYLNQGIIPRTLIDYFPEKIEDTSKKAGAKNKKRDKKLKNKKRISRKSRQTNRTK